MPPQPDKVPPLSAADIEVLSRKILADIQAGRLEESLQSLNQILDTSPAHPFALWHKAVILMRRGNMHGALTDLYALLHAQPSNLEVRNQIRFIHRKLVGNWHFDMMNDTARNNAYFEAIERAVNKDTVVFEIGTGSGLLSMMAARAGAKHVYSCEKEMPIRNAAKQIIKKNGFADRITLLDKWSTSVQIPQDIPEPVDLIIAEIFGPGLLEEQAIHFFQDAKKRLLKPSGKIIPCKATMFCALFESEDIWHRAMVKDVCGFDLRLFNGLHDDPAIQLNLSLHPHTLLSTPITMHTVDFMDDQQPLESVSALSITTNHTGTCHGIVQWFELHTDEVSSVSTSPFAQRTHWDQQLQIFEKPFTVSAGQEVPLKALQFADRFSLHPQ